jgi:polysaccharide export outer membrane protein
MRKLAQLVLSLGLVGCVQTPNAGLEVLAHSTDASELALGPGDKFDIRVFGEPDFTGTYRVDPDGTISYPYVGQVKVDGLRPNEVSKLIREKLAEKYLRNPQVSVLVQEQVSKKITIIGQVAHPGTFPFTANMNVVEAITVAGGFTPIASKDHTTITRIEAGRKFSIEVPVGRIGEGKAQNVSVRPGDIISVPERMF